MRHNHARRPIEEITHDTFCTSPRSSRRSCCCPRAPAVTGAPSRPPARSKASTSYRGVGGDGHSAPVRVNEGARVDGGRYARRHRRRPSTSSSCGRRAPPSVPGIHVPSRGRGLAAEDVLQSEAAYRTADSRLQADEGPPRARPRSRRNSTTTPTPASSRRSRRIRSCTGSRQEVEAAAARGGICGRAGRPAGRKCATAHRSPPERDRDAARRRTGRTREPRRAARSPTSTA